MDSYAQHFCSYRHDISDKARQYASGLMQAGSRKNMDRMAGVVPEAKSHNLQQFLTHSKWNHMDVMCHRMKVNLWDSESDKVRCRGLIVTKALGDNPDTKISLSNAPKSRTLKHLAWMQRQCYWVERGFEDAKSERGMADYQVRKWTAWHHHMALVMMAMLFMVSETMQHKQSYPLLSCADIEDLLAYFLPRRDVTEEEGILQLEERHKQRQKAIESHARRQAKNNDKNRHNGGA